MTLDQVSRAPTVVRSALQHARRLLDRRHVRQSRVQGASRPSNGTIKRKDRLVTESGELAVRFRWRWPALAVASLSTIERRDDADSAVHLKFARTARRCHTGGCRARLSVNQLVRAASAAQAHRNLVNNAGKILIQSVDQMTEEGWNDMIASNLTSCFLVTQAVLPSMRARHWGRIINMSSVAAQAGSIVGVHYAASKAGMIGLTRSYARVLAKEGITVNAITPALVATEMVISNPVAKPDASSRGALRRYRRGGGCRFDAGAQRLHHGSNHQRQRRILHELVERRLLTRMAPWKPA